MFPEDWPLRSTVCPEILYQNVLGELKKNISDYGRGKLLGVLEMVLES